MTFNSNADVRASTAKRRGPGAAVAGGAGLAGLGGIAVLLLSLFTGNDFTSLLGGGQPTSVDQGTAIEDCETGADANENDDCRLAAAQLVLDRWWETKVRGYRAPQLIIVDGSTGTPCGTASNATGPFYCPSDETVYIDPTFFGLLHEQFGAQAGALAQLYVVGHEWGHHIQQITGTTDRYPNNGTGPDSNGVRTELQADCFAGAWISDMATVEDDQGVTFLQEPTAAQIRDALDAAAAVGDDHIQAQSGSVNPESWTHGSSEQRQRWFSTGYEYGLGQCDTFAPAGGDL